MVQDMSDLTAQPGSPDIIVVMGVSGSGKSTVAKGIATTMGWDFAEGDEFHPKANVDKMASGIPLTDEDRWPWLHLIGDWISERVSHGQSAVVACSALRRAYRDILRDGRPQVRFCHVLADPEVIEDRMEEREGHYMPASLLPSQLATLEDLEEDEPGVVIPNEGSAAEVLGRALRLVALGLGVGLFAASLLTGLLEKLLFDVEPHDPWTFGATAILLLVVAVIASCLPARRGMRIAPVEALRVN